MCPRTVSDLGNNATQSIVPQGRWLGPKVFVVSGREARTPAGRPPHHPTVDVGVVSGEDVCACVVRVSCVRVRLAGS